MNDSPWPADPVGAILEQLYEAQIYNPELLLEKPGAGIGADVIYAMLIGHDEQIDHIWRLHRPEPELFTPIVARLSPLANCDERVVPTLRRASYRPTNFASWMHLAQPLMGEAFGFHDPMGGRVALLRYKRQV